MRRCVWIVRRRGLTTQDAGRVLPNVPLPPALGTSWSPSDSRFPADGCRPQAWAWLCLLSADGLKRCHPNWPGVNRKIMDRKLG